MVYTIDDYTFCITVGVIAGLIVLGISKALDWAKDIRLDVNENIRNIAELKRNVEELERELENMFGAGRP